MTDLSKTATELALAEGYAVDFQGLRKEFPPELIGKVPAGDRRPPLDFVGHAAVTDRLIQCAPAWTFSIDDRFQFDNKWWVQVTITIGGISRSDMGDGNDPKKAVSNALKRAAMRFGVALDLWSKEDLESVEGASGQEKVSTKTQEPALAPSAPSVTDKGSTGALNAGNGKNEEGGPDGEAGPTLLDHLYKAYGNGNKVLMAARKLYADVSPPNSVAELSEERMQELLDRVGV